MLIRLSLHFHFLRFPSKTNSKTRNRMQVFNHEKHKQDTNNFEDTLSLLCLPSPVKQFLSQIPIKFRIQDRRETDEITSYLPLSPSIDEKNNTIFTYNPCFLSVSSKLVQYQGILLQVFHVPSITQVYWRE